MSVYELGDEGLGRRLGPKRVALWFDEEPEYRKGNERFWRVRRALIKSAFWDRYSISEVPLIPEWFGSLLDHEHAYRESGYPWIWCVVLGFPTAALRTAALKIVKAESPSGLVKIEINPPDPAEYSLPLVGFLARSVYLTLEPGCPRRYDSWRGYETLALVDEDGSGLAGWSDLDDAERILLHRLALHVGKSLEAPTGRPDLEALVDHARELWALGAIAASGAVAGTAMERVLADSLSPSDQDWATGATLGPLIEKAVRRHGITYEQSELLHALRKLRNRCAHALSDEEAESGEGLKEAVDKWLIWLEANTGEAPGAPLGEIEVTPDPPEPSDLHAQADAAGRAAARAHVPRPMRVSTDSGPVEVVEEGVCGGAVILLSSDDPLSQWLVTARRASVREGKVRMPVLLKTQSMERAVAYAQGYIGVLHTFGLSADYVTRID